MNKMCKPVPHCQYPIDYAKSVLRTIQNQENLVKEGPGFSWFRSNRLNTLHHMSLLGIVKFAVFNYRYKKTLNEKLEMLTKKNI